MRRNGRYGTNQLSRMQTDLDESVSALNSCTLQDRIKLNKNDM